jgi:hypothetical protein
VLIAVGVTLADDGSGIDALLSTAQVTLAELAAAAERQAIAALLILSNAGSAGGGLSVATAEHPIVVDTWPVFDDFTDGIVVALLDDLTDGIVVALQDDAITV